MEKSLGDSFALILVLFLVIIGGYVTISMRRRSGLEDFPSGEKRTMLVNAIAKMTAENKPHIEQLKYLRQQGLHKNVAAALLKDFANKHHAHSGNSHATILPPPANPHSQKTDAHLQVN